MTKVMILRLGRHRLMVSAFFMVIISLLFMRGGYPADPIPADLHYPVIELKSARFLATRRPQSLELAGARNEYLVLRCRFPGADPASFKIKVVEAGRQSAIPQLGVAFYQLCWAPPGSRGKLPPDALLPLDQGLLSTGDALEIVTTLHIPPDFPKGSFLFELVATDKNQIFRQPITIRVYKFALADDLPIPILGGFWNYSPDHYAKYGVNSFEKYLQVIESYYPSMRHYKINVLGGAYPFPFDELHPDKKIEEFQDYHQLVDYALNQAKFHRFMIPKLRGWRTINQPGDTFISRANVFYPLYQDYLKRHGWQDRALNYLIDEPKPEEYPAVQQAFTTSKNLAPTIKTLCAGWNPDPEFVKVIDIWATPASHYKESQANAARSQGHEQWLYANRLHAIDHPHIHQRLIGWIIYRYQFNGYLLWGVNYWPNDPWTTEPSDADDMRRGTFYYPHPQTGLPVPTLRLESLRRGLQDYQYFHLMAEAHQKSLIPQGSFAQIEQKLQAFTANFQGSDFQVPMQELESLRLQMGNLLDGAGQTPGTTSSEPPPPPPPIVDQPPKTRRFLRDLWNSLRNRI